MKQNDEKTDLVYMIITNTVLNSTPPWVEVAFSGNGGRTIGHLTFPATNISDPCFIPYAKNKFQMFLKN